MEDGLSLRVVIGHAGTIKLSAATYNERGKSVQTPLGTFPHISRPDANCTFGKPVVSPALVSCRRTCRLS